ncbi:hypothetical protein DL93DRAFT_2080263 [Clavulina sp. PMI_390]|nr:hypothetical protein DL93DRAFT_2080263 [Clavulina sp. PMI_390]
MEIFLESTFWGSSVPKDSLPTTSEQQRYWWRAFDLLVAYFPRCNRLTIHPMYIDPRRLWGALQHVDFSRLEHFSFEDAPEDPSDPSSWITDTSDLGGAVRMKCPSLASLRFATTFPHDLYPFPLTPSLRHLDIKTGAIGLWWDSVVATVSELPMLERLVVDFADTIMSDSWDMTVRVELNYLESLDTNFPPFAVNLYTPNLTKLMFHDIDLDMWTHIVQNTAYREYYWPHPTLGSPMSGIHTLSLWSFVRCEFEWTSVSGWDPAPAMARGTEIVKKMMMEMSDMAVDTLEFVDCSALEGILRGLSQFTAPTSHRSDVGHAGISQEPLSSVSFLLPFLRRLRLASSDGELSSSVADEVADLVRLRPSLEVEWSV